MIPSNDLLFAQSGDVRLGEAQQGVTAAGEGAELLVKPVRDAIRTFLDTV